MAILKTIYKDTVLWVVEKPAGLPTLPSPRGRKETVASCLVEISPTQAELPDCGIVHRLDNETSGLIIIARNSETYQFLRSIWNTDQVRKKYWVLISGRMTGSGVVETPIAHHPRKKKKMVVNKLHGRPAVTHWKVSPSPFPFPSREGVWGRGGFTFLEVTIATGVRHQIRIHMASIGHPLVGDALYNRRKKGGSDPKQFFLHLAEVILPHPVTHRRLAILSHIG